VTRRPTFGHQVSFWPGQNKFNALASCLPLMNRLPVLFRQSPELYEPHKSSEMRLPGYDDQSARSRWDLGDLGRGPAPSPGSDRSEVRETGLT